MRFALVGSAIYRIVRFGFAEECDLSSLKVCGVSGEIQ